jgi:hypothetical protein
VDPLLILLRLTHILLGAVWVGMMVMNVVFLMPTLRDAGPAAGPVMAGLQRRKFMVVIPVMALLTILSGAWLMMRVWGGVDGLMASRPGQTYATGATLAIVAFIIGITIMRPAMMRAAALAQAMGSVQDGTERATRTAEMERLRARGALFGRLVTVLLVLATAAMAVARYV